MVHRLLLVLVASLGIIASPAPAADEDFAPAYGDGVHTDLQVASWLGDRERVWALLESGVGVDAVDEENGATPLMFAAAGGHVEVMEQLIAFGADPNALSGHKAPVITYAIEHSQHEAALVLLAGGVDVNEPWFGGTTPLLAASYRGDYEMMGLLLDAGADPGARYPNGVCALSSAAASGSVESVRLLLDLDLDIESKNDHGSTPLMFAAIGGHADVIALLIEAGAVVDAAREHGDTP